MKIVTYLINLDGSDTRLAQAKKQLDENGIEFERVSAFDGRGLNPSALPEYDEHHALSYMGRQLKGGELGCYLSHLNCAKLFLQSNADYAVVLEDDMVLREHVSEAIVYFLQWLEDNPISWFLINIGAEKRKIYSPLVTYNNTYELIQAHYFPMTTTGLIWSREGASAFVEGHQTIFAPVDNYFRKWLTSNDKGLAVYPPLVVASGAPSDIDKDSQKRKKLGRNRFYGWIKQKRLWGDKVIAFYHKILN